MKTLLLSRLLLLVLGGLAVTGGATLAPGFDPAGVGDWLRGVGETASDWGQAALELIDPNRLATRLQSIGQGEWSAR